MIDLSFSSVTSLNFSNFEFVLKKLGCGISAVSACAWSIFADILITDCLEAWWLRGCLPRIEDYVDQNCCGWLVWWYMRFFQYCGSLWWWLLWRFQIIMKSIFFDHLESMYAGSVSQVDKLPAKDDIQCLTVTVFFSSNTSMILESEAYRLKISMTDLLA